MGTGLYCGRNTTEALLCGGVSAVVVSLTRTPRTDWPTSEREQDAKGFFRKGGSLAVAIRAPHQPRDPAAETNDPGVFVAGDVRSESVKRFASTVSGGAMAVHFVHELESIADVKRPKTLSWSLRTLYGDVIASCRSYSLA